MFDRDTLRRRIGDALDAQPDLWHMTQVFRFRNSRVLRKLVTPEHDLVLEGFPRCGNSFAERAFVFANRRVQAWAIATHAHRVAQVALAVRYGLPTAIFIREPDKAITSLAALHFASRPASDQLMQRFVTDKTEYYTKYHDFVLSKRSALIVSEFATTTKNFGKVIDALNEKFGTEFARFSDTPEDVAEIFNSTKVHLSPSPERDLIKDRMSVFYLSAKNASARARAEDSYAKLLAAAI